MYIYILQESFTICYHGYGLLKRFSDIFQPYLAINQQRVTCLELARIFRLRLRTSKLLSVILYRLKLLPLVDYYLVQFSQHSYEKNIHLLFGWINRYFSDINYYISQKRTVCDQAAIHFRNKQVIYYHNQTSYIFYLFGWINLAIARTNSLVCDKMCL